MSHKDKILKIMGEHLDVEDDDMKEILTKVVADLDVYIQSVSKSAAKATGGGTGTGKTTVKAKATSKSSSDVQPERRYQKFVKLCSKRSKNQVAIDLEVTPTDNFTKKDTKSYAIFSEKLQGLLDAPQSFDDMFDAVTAETSTIMSTAGICWGLLSDDSRNAVLELAD